MAAVSEAPRRLLQDCGSVLDHQTPRGGAGQSQHGEADVLRLVRSGEAGSYRCVLVRASDQRAEPSPLRVGAQAQPHARCDRRHFNLTPPLLRYVCIAMEAMEQLLLACHCQSINLLVESFLSMLRLLLEADKPHLYILATNSFVKFANIEEDTPSYHRSYDFFVSRFSEMCHSEHEDLYIQNKHLDTHSLWEGPSFAVQCFQIIMYSIQLRQSVDYQLTGYYDNAAKHKTTSDEEKTLQDAVIKTIGSFANTLPVYQRSEVMLFIMGKIPVPGIYPALGSPNSGFEGSRMIQVMLLKSLLQVSEHYESTNLLTALPSSFLEPLLSFTLMEEPEIRLLVLSILTSLIDRHHNAARLVNVSVMFDVSVLELKEDACCHQDILFIRKHAQRLYRHVYLTCKEESSGKGHYQALITLLAVLSIELVNNEVLVDLIRLVLALQELALSSH
ncbi:hypothetical protein fugu_002270 [Takifugu bimaculatus]|uniref:Uncharacterized protein n=1 Tax=Takifugu bimaculatus TaxID=433685 RepID=A0A4Z2BP72_9TELE|nr:hypothetical protein fugu_002270 [Takifugu bimaculatus]